MPQAIPECLSVLDPQRIKWRNTGIFQIIAFTTLGVFASVTGRYLFADGSLFLLSILETQKVSEFFPTRYFAHFVTQLPPVVVINWFGCRDLQTIGTIYGLSLFLTPVIGLIGSWWAARSAPISVLAFPLLSQSILCMTGSLAIFTEDFPAAWLFWCILYLLLFSETLNGIRSVALIACTLLATRTYESYMLLAWIPLFFACRRAISALSQRKIGEFSACAVCGVLLLYSVFISVWSTVFPRDPQNRTLFANAILDHLRSYSVQFSLLILFGALVVVLIPGIGWKTRSLFWTVALTDGVFVELGPFVGIHEAWVLQHTSRVQGLYVPFLLGLAAVIYLQSRRETSDSIQRDLRCLVLWTSIVTVAFQVNTTICWWQYRNAMATMLSEKQGLISYQAAYNRPREFDWNWSLCLQSLLIGGMDFGTVRSVVCVPDGTGWQPFDPKVPEKIPDLTSYGVTNVLGGDKQRSSK